MHYEPDTTETALLGYTRADCTRAIAQIDNPTGTAENPMSQHTAPRASV